MRRVSSRRVQRPTFLDRRHKLRQSFENDAQKFYDTFEKLQDDIYHAYKTYLFTSRRRVNTRHSLRSFIGRRLKRYEDYLYCGPLLPLSSDTRHLLRGLHLIVDDKDNTVCLEPMS